jgi:hypothetical protein
LLDLFIDHFEKFFTVRLPAVGAQVAHKLIRVLLHADDLVLWAESTCDLQAMFNVLHEFCVKSQWSIHISIALSKDGECLLQQAAKAASSIIRSRRDDERQGFKLLNYICGFLRSLVSHTTHSVLQQTVNKLLQQAHRNN